MDADDVRKLKIDAPRRSAFIERRWIRMIDIAVKLTATLYAVLIFSGYIYMDNVLAIWC